MVQGATVQERRILNDAIESAYIECAGLAAGIRTHKQTGRGAITDLYENFHYNFGILVDLTSDLEEMKSDADITKRVIEWLDNTSQSAKDVETRCLIGRDMFKDYRKALNACGLIALPSRGK